MESQKNIWLNNFKNQIYVIYFDGEFYNDHPVYKIQFLNNNDFISFKYEERKWRLFEKNNLSGDVFTLKKNKYHPYLLPITDDWNLKNTLIEDKQIKYFNSILDNYEKLFIHKFNFWNTKIKDEKISHFIRNFIFSTKKFNLPEDIIIYILRFIFTSEMSNFVKNK